jgi:hypothetical protein
MLFMVFLHVSCVTTTKAKCKTRSETVSETCFSDQTCLMFRFDSKHQSDHATSQHKPESVGSKKDGSTGIVIWFSRSEQANQTLTSYT